MSKNNTDPKPSKEDEYIQNLELLGLASAEAPTFTNLHDRICRWFSTSFSTPLLEVLRMDPYFVFRHYFEDKYLRMKEDDYNEYLKQIDRIFFPERGEADDRLVEELKAEVAAEEAARKAAEEAKAKHNLQIPEQFQLPESGKLTES